MIGKALFLLLVFAMPIAQAQDELVQDKSHGNPLVGTWRLIRYVDTPKGGKPVHVFGESPIGRERIDVRSQALVCQLSDFLAMGAQEGSVRRR